MMDKAHWPDGLAGSGIDAHTRRSDVWLCAAGSLDAGLLIARWCAPLAQGLMAVY
jgi:hypothetical protein